MVFAIHFFVMLIFGRFTTAVDLLASVGMSQAHLIAREGNPASDVCNRDLEDVMIYERLDKSSGNSKQSNKSMFHISKLAPLNSLDCVLFL